MNSKHHSESTRFSFTLTPTQRLKLKRLAELDEISEAAFLRKLIREADKTIAKNTQNEEGKEERL